MTQITGGVVSRLAVLALVLLVARTAESKSLDEFVRIFESTCAGMDPEQRQAAELFASTLGNNRRYRYELKLVPALYEEAQLAPLRQFLGSFKELKESGDSDAVVETLMKLKAPELSEEELADGKRVAELVDEKLKPACREFYFGLSRSLFESADFKEAEASGQLEREIASQGALQSVKDFLFGWAHYHTCHLLLLADEAFFQRVARRAPSYFRVKARMAARG